MPFSPCHILVCLLTYFFFIRFASCMQPLMHSRTISLAIPMHKARGSLLQRGGKADS